MPDHNIDLPTFVNKLFEPEIADGIVCLAKPSRGGGGGYEHFPYTPELAAKIQDNPDSWYVCVSTVSPPKGRDLKQRRRKQDALTAWVIMLDDIGTKVDMPPIDLSALIETSEGNYQGLLFIEPYDVSTVEGLAHFEDCNRAILEAGYGDKSAAGVNRIFRVPGSVNTKEGRNGWQSVVTEWNPDLIYTLDYVMELLSLEPMPGRGGGQTYDGALGTGDGTDDPAYIWLASQGLIGAPNSFGYDVQCPWESEHTGPAGGTSYSPLDQGAVGEYRIFNCMHEHCIGRSGAEFLAWIGSQGGPILDMQRGIETAYHNSDGENNDTIDGSEGDDASDYGLDEDDNGMNQARDMTLSEINLAAIFTDRNPDLRYVDIWGQWFDWSGSVWTQEKTLMVSDLVSNHLKEMAIEMEFDAGKRTKWLRAGVISGVERIAKADRRYAKGAEDWDNDPWLLNTPDGVVELKTGEIRDNVPGDYMTKQTAVVVGEGAAGACPLWLNFLDQVTGGDKEYAGFLQRVMGYCLTGSTKEHAMFFLHGSGGNGKGVFLNTMEYILKDYAQTAPVATFTQSKQDAHPTDLAMLRGARMVIAQETEEGKRWAEARIKSVTGGDAITARLMRQDFFTYIPQFKLLISGNHKPAITPDEAMQRRFHLLPFTVDFTGQAMDLDLPEKLRAEAPGILNWAVNGTAQYLEHGLGVPAVVRQATDEYFLEEDFHTQWLHECCDTSDPGYRVTYEHLLISWKDFAHKSAVPEGSPNALPAFLKKKFGNTKIKQQRGYKGLKIKLQSGIEPPPKNTPSAFSGYK